MDTNKHESRNWPLQLESGGERTTGQAFISRSRRHDPPFSELSDDAMLALLQIGLEPDHTLVVRREFGMFTLFETRDGKVEAAVCAPNAQTIIDYLEANWPVGTRVQWIVVPPFQPVRTNPIPLA
jgi:hypothetical protein